MEGVNQVIQIEDKADLFFCRVVSSTTNIECKCTSVVHGIESLVRTILGIDWKGFYVLE